MAKRNYLYGIQVGRKTRWLSSFVKYDQHEFEALVNSEYEVSARGEDYRLNLKLMVAHLISKHGFSRAELFTFADQYGENVQAFVV